MNIFIRLSEIKYSLVKINHHVEKNLTLVDDTGEKYLYL